jgi:hypothetical protein
MKIFIIHVTNVITKQNIKETFKHIMNQFMKIFIIHVTNVITKQHR